MGSSQNYFIIYSFLLATMFIIIMNTASRIVKEIIRFKKKNSIRHNMKKNKYILYYQPIVNYITKEIIAFEALVRFETSKEIFTPDKFIHEIYEAKMMEFFTLYLFEKIVDDYKFIFKKTYQDKIYISLNISFKEIVSQRFIDGLIQIITEKGLSPEFFCLEIIEKEKIPSDNILIFENIKMLKKKGFLIALDDFGTEYSNFDILTKIPHDIVKIDKLFVDNLSESSTCQIFLKTLAKIANDNGKKIIIEGVETKEQIKLIELFNFKDTFVQGYYYSKPFNLEDNKDKLSSIIRV